MNQLPEDIKNIISELETFLSDVLKGENLSKKTKDKKESLIKKIKDVKLNHPQDFNDKGEFEDPDEEGFPQPPDNISLASDRDKDDEFCSEGNQPVAAQDLVVSKAGYLEKRRKDHNFFASDWQKRWCVISKSTFYYYGSDKDKQQKGEFSLEGYRARMNNTLRKDAKKDCCFEIFATDKRVYQFAAPTPKEAEEWVNSILYPQENDGDLYDDVNQPEVSPPVSKPVSHEEDIYEVLPEDESQPIVTEIQKPLKAPISQTPPSSASGKETDYANYYRGLWDCMGDQSDELSFKHGDVIYILSKEYNRYGWWVGEMKGTIGLVPKAYIMEMYDI